MSKGTDRRTVRIAPDIWDAARAVAAERGETVSDVVRACLIDYVRSQPEITKAFGARPARPVRGCADGCISRMSTPKATFEPPTAGQGT